MRAAWLVLAAVACLAQPSPVVRSAALPTTGAIPYVTSPGVLAEDSPGLHWDAANNRLGVGTTSPSTAQEISGTAAVLRITGTAATIPGLELSSAGVVTWKLQSNWNGSSGFAILQDNTERFTILSGGNVGIGTTVPGARLHSLATTEQLRLGYDASNYASFTVGLSGSLTTTTIGDISLTPAGTLNLTSVGTTGIVLKQPSAGNPNYLAFNNAAGTVKGMIGLANNANDLITGTVANDMALRMQSSNLLISTDGGTTANVSIKSTGNILIGTTTDSNFKLDVGNSGSAGTFRAYDQTAVTGTTKAVIRAGAGQSGNLFEVQNNAGTALANIEASGDVRGTFASLSGTGGELGNDGVRLSSTAIAKWSSTVNYYGTADIGLSRNAAGVLEINNGTAGGANVYALLGKSDSGALITTVSRTITGAVTDGYTASVSLSPTYTAATAQTVTRHNYINLANPTLSGAGPAALTDATVMRFDAAAGTHKAVDSGTTKTTPGTVDGWLKINVNGTIYYIPAYTSKTT